MDSSGSGYKLISGICEDDNEPSGTIKWRDFLEELLVGFSRYFFFRNYRPFLL